MRADHAVRHNTAVGALLGLAVGDALNTREELPQRICGGDFALRPWGEVAERSFEVAERVLRHDLLDIDLDAASIIGAAIALADPSASPPLLADPEAVLMCTLVRSGMGGDLDLGSAAQRSSIDPTSPLAKALEIVDAAGGFCEAIAASSAETRTLVGAVAGLGWGPAAIPAAWATRVHGPVGGRTYGLRQLRRLAERLMKEDAPVPPEPRRSLGPREVAPKLWLSNLHAVSRFLADHPEGAVISLCPTTGAFDQHSIRREFSLHDAGGRTVNANLSATVDEILATIDCFHAEGRDVLVHCHHGASRTGLILRAWLIAHLDLNEDDATTEAQVRWPKTSTWNTAFNKEIARRAAPPGVT